MELNYRGSDRSNFNNNNNQNGMSNGMMGGEREKDSGEFFANFQGVSPEMLNMGLSAGQATMDRMVYQVMPNMSSFWNSLKVYFAVNNKYVVNKLSRILYPLGTKSWTRVKNDDQYSGSMSTGGVDASTTHKYALPKNDINAPDLYIPLMSFITYVLLVGYCKGASNKFTPEDLVNAVWRCLLLQLCECALIKFGVSSMQANIPFMDIFAYTGYKYIGLCIGLIALVFGQSFFFLVTMVMSLSLGYFVMKTLAFAIPEQCVGFLPRPVMIIVFAGLQSFVFCLLSL